MRLVPLALLVVPLAAALPLSPPLEEAALGFAAHPLVAIPAPTAINFGVDGHLYATDLAGDVLRVSLAWTPAGPVVTGVETVASGFSQPLGVAQAPDGALFVSDSHPNPDTGRTDGYVARIAPDGTRSVVVDGVPNGRHNTNHLRFGPTGGSTSRTGTRTTTAWTAATRTSSRTRAPS